ncbi:SsgA family sporulation/cell division regulator [Streptomyces sp. YS415]|uniref:SsgA family sporulation/cell division regulator n=1 Tax=Streptomyces sp. YS415 TaxID=2944806 RepID=UPI0020225F70|nr:SsgA family sporulation/cell division regulator [Streptomyces sp. YS415]MCL7429155.1 SsgA family sporulation/cell division regulator [Streptomyces sp. YS415]
MQPIEHVVTAHVSTPEHAGGCLVVRIRHLPEDPLAVRLDFAPTDGSEQSTTTWAFARSLLTEGVDAPSGEGDVRVWPEGTYETHIQLHTVRGQCVVRLRTAALRSFLARTELWFPRVDQQVETDLNRFLASVLRHA